MSYNPKIADPYLTDFTDNRGDDATLRDLYKGMVAVGLATAYGESAGSCSQVIADHSALVADALLAERARSRE